MSYPGTVQAVATANAHPGFGIAEEPLQVSGLTNQGTLPLLVEPTIRYADVCAWAADHRGFIATQLRRHGALLLRNFQSVATAGFQELIRTIAGAPLEYHERSSPRTQVGGNIYTSTDYPAGKSILLHNENSYQNSWPLRNLLPLRDGRQARRRNAHRRLLPGVGPHQSADQSAFYAQGLDARSQLQRRAGDDLADRLSDD